MASSNLNTDNAADNTTMILHSSSAGFRLHHVFGGLSIKTSTPTANTSNTKLIKNPIGWTVESVTLERFAPFRKLPLEIRTMIWILHHDETFEIVVDFKKTVTLAKNPKAIIKNKFTNGFALKRLWWNRVRAYTPMEKTPGLTICKDSADAYRLAKPDVIQYLARGARIHFNKDRDVILFNAEHCYLPYLHAIALHQSGGYSTAFRGLASIKRVLFTYSSLVFDINKIIAEYKDATVKAETGRRDKNVKKHLLYPMWIKQAQDYEIKQIKRSSGNAQGFMDKFVALLQKNGVAVWQEGENNEYILAPPVDEQ